VRDHHWQGVGIDCGLGVAALPVPPCELGKMRAQIDCGGEHDGSDTIFRSSQAAGRFAGITGCDCHRITADKSDAPGDAKFGKACGQV
jgi:hypothetical protein